MPISAEDASALLAALQTSLLEAGYADAADQLRRVANEPLRLEELDDQFDEEAIAYSVLAATEQEHEHEGSYEPSADAMLEEPDPMQRLSAALKIVDLMVTEPLRIELGTQSALERIRLDAHEVTVGQGEAQVAPAGSRLGSRAALDTWTHLLHDLRGTLD
jgi:hypothetical protein